ncbi:MAG: cation-translocating P-type ATPase [Anaerolineae bacterium]|nr:MAG: cation-translocating P-type ATPase [Anaerolineae bacterium]
MTNAKLGQDGANGETRDWHSMSADEALAALETSAQNGLTTEQVAERTSRYGLNQLTEAPPPSFWALLWAQFKDFVVMLLIGASVISAFLGEWVEAAAIMAIVVLNAILGIVQERRAEQALAALKQLAAPEASVIRNGQRETVPARELVPGDIVMLEAGNYIPADVRLVETVNLRIEEAALTGESVPVQKDAGLQLDAKADLGDRKNSAYLGTLTSYGRGKALVVETGMQTEIGRIAAMLAAVEQEQTPLQKRLEELGKTLGWAALGICALVFLIGWLRGNDPLEMFLVAVSLAIAAVPEGLPAIVTISLALGMREMIARNALIRRLSSVETLGSATTIGSDKTGTLTQNEMTVTHLSVDGKEINITGTGYAPEGRFEIHGEPVDLIEYPASTTALWVGALSNDAQLVRREQNGQTTHRMIGDPTEGAIIVAAAKASRDYEHLSAAYPRVQEIPFDSVRKRMTTIHKVENPRKEDFSPFVDNDPHAGSYVVAVKGAPDVVLDLCKQYQQLDDSVALMTEGVRQRVLAANKDMASQALRVIGMAYKVVKALPETLTPETVETDLIFVGLVGMIDPPREEVKDSLAKARAAGIRTVMITGDYPDTAKAIAEHIGLIQPGHGVLAGHELNEMSDEELARRVNDVDVFARVSPEHKVRIVRALRANNQVVAMTGDGVNDAPALKQADIGVAMGITGTDVAKETADMVLTDDNYSSIVSAIEQGRIIYSNIRKFVFFLLSCNTAEIAIIFTAILVDLPSPLNPIQLLWLNLLTDGAPALALGMEKGDPDIMDQKPRPANEPIIDREMRIGILIQTIVKTIAVLGAYLLGLKQYPMPDGHAFNPTAATMAFVTLAFCELLRAYTARSEHYPLLKIGVFSNKSMNWAVLISAVLILVVVYIPFLNGVFETVPLGWTQWLEVMPLIWLPAIAAEITKVFLSRRAK